MEEQLRALADPTRRAILHRLSGGELSAGAIASRFRLTRPAISHHLAVLREAGLVEVRREAQSRLYAIDAAAVGRLRAAFDRFWEDALPRLKSVVESERGGAERRRT